MPRYSSPKAFYLALQSKLSLDRDYSASPYVAPEDHRCLVFRRLCDAATFQANAWRLTYEPQYSAELSRPFQVIWLYSLMDVELNES